MNLYRILFLKRSVCLTYLFSAISTVLICAAVFKINSLTNESCNKIKNGYGNLQSKKSFAESDIKENVSRSVWMKLKTKGSSHLKHVFNAFKAFNYKILEPDSGKLPDKPWNIVWSHKYPFTELRSYFNNLKGIHCINHFPGSGFITNKLFLASSGILSIPKAFQIPKDKVKLLNFAQDKPEVLFVQKGSNHRGIEIKKISELNFDDKLSFVQEFIHNPLLIDGYKFDIGIYTVITSVNPLRVYIHQEVLFRFCTEKYYPFFANDSRKYVVGDDYRPTWEVPSLQHYYQIQKLGMKGSFDAWLRNSKKDPSVVWQKVQESIRAVFEFNEENIIQHSENFPSNLKFFEVMRFDLIIDKDLNVYLMEANMSPNLSSAHFKENRLLYEQVVFNLLSLIGLSYNRCLEPVSVEQEEMRCSHTDVTVFPEHCSAYCTDQVDCSKVECQLCHLCLKDNHFEMLRAAFLEHTWRGSYRRILPVPLKLDQVNNPVKSEHLSHKNTLMAEWFRGKCLLDETFCS